MIRNVLLCALAVLSLGGCATTAAPVAPTPTMSGVPDLAERTRQADEALRAALRARVLVCEEDARLKAADYETAKTLEAQAAEALRVAKERTKAMKALSDAAAKRLAACKANESKCAPEPAPGVVGSPRAP